MQRIAALILVIFASMLIVYQCSHKKRPFKDTAVSKKIPWLEGTWKMKLPEGEVIEIWDSKGKFLMGESYYIENKDTLFAEKIRIENFFEHTLYVVKPGKGDPVSFTLQEGFGHQLVFANKEHDYPQKIVYTKIDDNTIEAIISGIENGKEHSEKFRYIRSDD